MSAALQPFDRSTGESWMGPIPANDFAPAERTLLRFITCGSVDDGKSTLIGRLLFEAGSVPDDTLAALRADSAKLGNAGGALDYSLLMDGLQAEREQGITIDVAYRYFATPRRSFVGDNWRREIAPMASWRIGSALLFGLVFAVLTDSIILGIAAAVLDAIVRPVLRFLHRRFWKALWERKHRKAGPLQDGDGI